MNLGDLEGIGRLTEFGLRQLKRAYGAICKRRQSRRQDIDKLKELQKLVNDMRTDCENALSDTDWTSRNRTLRKLVARTRVRKIQRLANDLGLGFGDLHTRTKEIETLRSIHQGQAANVNHGRTAGDFPRSDLSGVRTELSNKLTELCGYIDTEVSNLPKGEKWA